jgi:ferredoxin-NADP reductase
MRVGDDVKVEAPNGTFIFDGAQADGVALIGAGVGITPMMSVARYLAETGWPGKVSLILGFRAPRDFILALPEIVWVAVGGTASIPTRDARDRANPNTRRQRIAIEDRDDEIIRDSHYLPRITHADP